MSFDVTNFATIQEVLKKIATDYPDHPAIQQYTEETWPKLSYKELLSQIEKHTVKLKQLGLKPGDRVAIIDENSIDWVIAFFAILSCQATAVVLDPRLEASDYENLLRLSDSQLVITSANALHKIPSAISKHLTILDINKQFALMNDVKTIGQNEDGDPTLAVMMFTSGTSGKYKAVMLEHRAILESIKMAHQASEVSLKDHFMVVLPLTHIYGLYTFLVGLFVRGNSTLLSKLQSDVILKTMQDTKTTVLCAVPRLFELFHSKIRQRIEKKTAFLWLMQFCGKVRRFTGFNLGKWIFFPIQRAFGGCKVFISGGASLNKNVHRDLHSLGFTIVQAYGLTETAAGVVGTSRQKPVWGVGGKPYQGVNLRIEPVPGHQGGEICIQSPSLMRGYFRDPEATAEAFKNGWFHTGDLGFLDKKGYLQITGRSKEVIVTSNGQKAMPQDVEERYHDLPGIKEMAVVGIPIGNGPTEEIHAAIVATEEFLSKHTPDVVKEKLKQLIEKQNEHIPTHLRVKNIHLVAAIPKTLTLKVKRGELRETLKKEMHADLLMSEIYCDDDPLTLELLELIAKVCEQSGKPVINLHPKMSFEMDLQFDSLTSLECSVMVEEHFRIRISRPEAIKTIADLEHAIRVQLKMPAHNVTKSSGFRDELLKEPELLQEDKELLNRKAPFYQRLTLPLLGWSYKKFFDLEVIGLENLPSGQFVLCSNHQSHLDALALIFATKQPIRNFDVFAARDYFFNGSYRRKILAQMLNLLPFSRANNKKEIVYNFQLAKKCIENKKNIILFPEGTRSKDGEMQDFKSFIGILAHETNVPIVPAFIDGTFECMPKGSIFPKKGKIRVIFGKPLNKQQSKDNNQLSDFNHYGSFAQMMQNEIAELKKR